VVNIGPLMPTLRLHLYDTRAAASGEEPVDLSARMTRLYQEDIEALGCARPTAEPRVSKSIPEIIALVEALIAKGSALFVLSSERASARRGMSPFSRPRLQKRARASSNEPDRRPHEGGRDGRSPEVSWPPRAEWYGRL